MKRPVFIITSVICIIIMLALVQVVVSNSLSTTGIEVEKLQEEIVALKKENTLLTEEILQRASLTSIASKAASLGFVDAKSPVSMSAPLPIAHR